VFGAEHLTLFLLSGILLNITPGQDTLYIIGRAIAQGRRAGLLSVLGISTGLIVHTFAAAFGLSAILATSASAFMAIKLIGAAYLVYLGVRMWFDRPASHQDSAALTPESPWAVYRAGVLTNVLNPKVALFFLAFLPQFIDPAADSKITAFLFLGAVFTATGTMWCVILALAASAIRRRLQTSSGISGLIRRVTGAVFVGLGVKLAVTE
jgi:RhtB (resistance to homoserine/threonine) family protein